MDERKTSAEPEGRRKKPENPLLKADNQKDQKKANQETRERAASRRTQPENPQKNVYKLRILTIILVLLIIALIAAFVSEIGIYGNPENRTKGSGSTAAVSVQMEQL